MKTVSAREVAEALNRIDIKAQRVLEGNQTTLEHGEVSIETLKPITLFVSPVNDTMYIAVWQTRTQSYKVGKPWHYAGQFHRVIREIRQACR